MKYFGGLLVVGLICWAVFVLYGGRANLADGQYEMRGSFAGPEDLSGLATLDGVNGVIVSDEPRFAQAITIDKVKRTITAGAKLPLFTVDGIVEADLEAVAADEVNHCYYVIGSHGASKRKGDFQEERCHIFRIPAEPKSGAPTVMGMATGSLSPWLAT